MPGDGQHRVHIQQRLLGPGSHIGLGALALAVGGDGGGVHGLPALRLREYTGRQLCLGGAVYRLHQRPVFIAVAVVVVGGRVCIGAVLAVGIGAHAHIFFAADGFALIQRLQRSGFFVIKGFFHGGESLALLGVLGHGLLQLPGQHRPAIAHFGGGDIVGAVRAVEVGDRLLYTVAEIPCPLDLIFAVIVIEVIEIQAIFALNGFAIGHIMRQISADLACRAEEIAGGIIRGNTAGTCSPVGVQSRIIMLRGGGGVAADDGGRAVSHTDKSAGIAHTITGSMNGGRVVAVFQRNFGVRPAHDAAVAVHIIFKRASDGAVVGAADDLVSIPIHIAHNAAHTGRTGANGKLHRGTAVFNGIFSVHGCRNGTVAEVHIIIVLRHRYLARHADILDCGVFHVVKQADLIAAVPVFVHGDINGHRVATAVEGAFIVLLGRGLDGRPVTTREVDVVYQLRAGVRLPLADALCKGHQIVGISDLVGGLLCSVALRLAVLGKSPQRQQPYQQHNRQQPRNSLFHFFLTSYFLLYHQGTRGPESGNQVPNEKIRTTACRADRLSFKKLSFPVWAGTLMQSDVSDLSGLPGITVTRS